MDNLTFIENKKEIEIGDNTNKDAAPVVRGTYVQATHVRAFLSGGTFVRGEICPGM